MDNLKELEILTEVQEISDFVYNGNRNLHSPDDFSFYLDKLSSYMARLPVLEADAEYLLNKARGKAAEKHRKETATLFREVVAGETAMQQRIYKLAHRMSTNFEEIIQSARSQLSLLKAQLPGANMEKAFEELRKMRIDIDRMKNKLEDKL